MNDEMALEMANRIFQMVFERDNTRSLAELKEKLARGIRLPMQVVEMVTGEEVWTIMPNGGKFISEASIAKIDEEQGWLKAAKDYSGAEEIYREWQNVNSMTTERVYESADVAKSDCIYGCEKVYGSADCRACKNVLYCSSCVEGEYLLACERSSGCNFCIGTKDSGSCSNSYNVICSNKIMNSFFVQDCFDLYECMFCAHIASRKFCIANRQFEQEEYFRLKKMVTDWLVAG